jgi:hypothetical protein
MVNGQSKANLHIETEWIRSYARVYLPTEAGFSFSPEMLRDRDISIIKIRYLLKNGEVVYADKLDDPGALWIVVGEDQDGVRYELELVVVSETQSVTLRNVIRDADSKEDGNDAA